jgi:hypothetical protein
MKNYGGKYYTKRVGATGIRINKVSNDQLARAAQNRAAFILKRQDIARQTALSDLRALNVPFSMPMGRVSTNEVKSFDVALTDPAVGLPLVAAATGGEPGAAFVGITEINCIRNGSAFYQRIGAKVVVRSIALHLNFYTSVAALANNAVTIRYMIIYDRQTNGAFPAIGDILALNDGAPTFTSGTNMSNKSRFMILRDKYLDFDPVSQLNCSIREFIKGKFDVEFGTNAGNIGDIKTGSIYLVAISDTNPGVSPILFTATSARIRYYD